MATTTNGELHQAIFNALKFDTYLDIIRSNEQCVRCSVAHGPLIGPTRLGIFIFDTNEERNPDLEDSEFIEMSAAEARLLKDFLNRPEVSALLDQE